MRSSKTAQTAQTETNHWYKIFYYDCPGCGRGWSYRERHHDPKPEDPNERRHYSEIWCGSCL